MDNSNMNPNINPNMNPNMNPMGYGLQRPPKKSNTGVWIAVIISIALIAIIAAYLFFSNYGSFKRDKYKENTFIEYSGALMKLEQCINDKSESLEDWCAVMYPRTLYEQYTSKAKMFGFSMDSYTSSMFDSLYGKIDDSVGAFTCKISVVSDSDVSEIELDELNDGIEELFESMDLDDDMEYEVTEAKNVRVKFTIDGEKKSFSKETTVMLYKYGDEWYINPNSLKNLKNEV